MKALVLRPSAAHPAVRLPARLPWFGPLLFPVLLAMPFPALAAADAAAPPEAPVVLDTVVVEASPFGRTEDELVHPVDVLAGEELERHRRGTLGDLLGERPGVANASFGPGVGRPVIRGQGGPRVQILDNGLSTMDASTLSPDHAVALDPMNAEQVEIIKGPATLIYGGGASAGLVNVVDDRLPEELSPGLRLRGNLSYGENADERNAGLRLRHGGRAWQLGASTARRQAGDFSIPGFAEREPPAAETHSGLLDNSAVDTRSYGASAARIGERGMAGAALTRFETTYGVPGHAHEGEQGEEAAEGGVHIELEQTRLDLRGLRRQPLPGFDRLETRIGMNDYTHREVEADGAVGSTFDVAEQELRAQLTHLPLAGWKGVAGVQLRHRDLDAAGEEAFAPPVRTRAGGLFVVEERPFGEHRLELGARLDRTEHRPEAFPPGTAAPAVAARGFSAYSLAAGGVFMLGEHLHLRLNAQRAQRAPAPEELYAFGPHAATASFERGAANLRAETANNLELALGRDHSRWTWELGAYINRIDDYVFQQEVDAGLNADGSGSPAQDGQADRVDETGAFDPQGELLLVDQVQRGAEFRGYEAESSFRLVDAGPWRLQLRAFGDSVRAELDSGASLPRIAPARLGLGVDARYGGLRAALGYTHAAAQDRVAALETPTPAYELVSADLSYTRQAGAVRTTVYLQGRNLTDEEVRLSTSLLKDIAPLPGRALFAGLRFDFEPGD